VNQYVQYVADRRLEELGIGAHYNEESGKVDERRNRRPRARKLLRIAEHELRSGSTYSEPVTFTIDPSLTAPFLLTTGGASNVFFEVATSTTGGVDIALPSDAG
jgi:hypothetical protein